VIFTEKKYFTEIKRAFHYIYPRTLCGVYSCQNFWV